VNANSLKVFHLINKPNIDFPLIIGNAARSNVIIKDEDLIQCHGLNAFGIDTDCEGVALIDDNILLLSNRKYISLILQ
jgi:hypothetical protein